MSANPPPLSRPSAAAITARIAVALLGGYAFTWGFAALAIAGGVALGAGYHDAEHAAMLLAFLVFLAAFLWTFATRRLLRLAVLLCGGGALMTAAAMALQRQLLA